MEKNVILAIVLSMIILIVYSVFFMPKFVQEQPVEVSQEKEAKEGEIIPREVERITLENPNLTITLDTRGAEIISWYLNEKKKELLSGKDKALRFSLEMPEGNMLNSEQIIFKVEEKEKRKVKLIWEDEEKKLKITQTFEIPEQGYYLFYNCLLENFPPDTHYSLYWPTKIGEKTGDEERIVFWNNYLYQEKEEGVKSEYDSKTQWLGIREKKDFIITMVPLQPVKRGIFKIDSWGFVTTREKNGWIVYAGPQSYTELRLVNNFVKANLGEDYHLTDAVKIGFWGYLSLGLIKTLIFFYSFTRSYGIAIILLTLLIYGALSPLTFKQFESMQKMQKIQPELKEVQKKFKTDPKKLQVEMMKIYSKHKINPLGGCLPMIFQLPIIFILYRALLDFNFAENPSFLWIRNLGKPDIPLLLGLGATMFLQQKISQRLQPAKDQEGIAKIMQFFPLFLILILWSLPSGVMLYWFTSTCISIIQQFLIAKRAAAD